MKVRGNGRTSIRCATIDYLFFFVLRGATFAVNDGDLAWKCFAHLLGFHPAFVSFRSKNAARIAARVSDVLKGLIPTRSAKASVARSSVGSPQPSFCIRHGVESLEYFIQILDAFGQAWRTRCYGEHFATSPRYEIPRRPGSSTFSEESDAIVGHMCRCSGL